MTSETTPETDRFQAETSELLQLIIHSLYSNREIFLRELISNASDAIDKLRVESLTHPELLSATHTEFEIRLIPDASKKTLSVVDNGIGMTFDEVKQFIGTIARSGTKALIKKNPELIGQFGVGFYSAFMVADRVSLHTQKAGSSEGVFWESTGENAYTIERRPRSEGTGTTVTLHLKDFKNEEIESENPSAHENPNYTDEWTLKSIVKKHSDFIAHPIRMKTIREEQEKDEKGEPIEGKTLPQVVDETLNSQKALWLKRSVEITPQEYEEFYQHLTHDYSKPARIVHFQAEGKTEFTGLLYLPTQKPWDYDFRDAKHGLALYVKRVFILSDAQELIPLYLRFVRGLIDSNDLSLNVSREILQKDRQVTQIRKVVTTKVLNALKEFLEKDRAGYEKFWESFGPTLKEGIINDVESQDRIKNLLLFRSTATPASGKSTDWTTLSEYVSRMKADQKSIFYIAGESEEISRNSPYLEKINELQMETLLLTDPIDEWVTKHLTKFEEKPLQSVTAAQLDLTSGQKTPSTPPELEGILKKIQSLLEDRVKEVRITQRLSQSPLCLVSPENESSAYFERLMDRFGKSLPKAKRILEINPEHPLFVSLGNLNETDQKEWVDVLYQQALLNEGSSISNPMELTQKIAKIMVRAASAPPQTPNS